MARRNSALDDVIQTAVERGQQIGNYLYHGWEIPFEVQDLWEQVLDGSYAETHGFPDREEEIAEAAMHARHCAFHTHDVACCDRHVAEYVMSQFDDEVEFVSR